MAMPAEAPAEADNTEITAERDLQLARRAAETILALPSQQEALEFDFAQSAENDLNDDKIVACENLLETRQKTQRLHNLKEITWQPPSSEKYPDIFKWDEAFADIMFFATARYCWEQATYYEFRLTQVSTAQKEKLLPIIGKFRQKAELFFSKGREGMRTSFAGMDDTGFISNSRVLTKSGVKQAGLERLIVKGGDSVYTQPVVEPLAAITGYQALLAKNPSGEMARQFLIESSSDEESLYDKLKLHLEYYDKFLADSPNRLLGIPHPHVSGMDSSHLYDHVKNRLPRKGEKTSMVTNLRNARRDYQWALKRTKEIVDANGDMEKIREGFNDKDVMVNGIYLDSIYQMAELAKRLGKTKDMQSYLQIASELEAEMQKMWNPNAWKGNGAFLNRDKDNNEIQKVAVGSFFGLLLRSLGAEQLESMLNMMDKSFNTPYGIPSHPTDHDNSDMRYREWGRIWRGPSWDNVNWYIVERGLCMQAEREDLPVELRERCINLALKVTKSSNRGLNEHGQPSEFRNPVTGEPQRKRVKNFTWGWLPRFMGTAYILKDRMEKAASVSPEI